MHRAFVPKYLVKIIIIFVMFLVECKCCTQLQLYKFVVLRNLFSLFYIIIFLSLFNYFYV